MSCPNQPTAKPFPKILCIHDYRPEALALADLIRQIFLGYPTEKIHWWHCRDTALYREPDFRAASLHGCCIPEKLVPQVRWTNTKSFLLERFWAPYAARHLERAIAKVEPDLVWSLLYGWSIPALARVRWPTGLPLHVSVWDFPDIGALEKSLGAKRSQRFVSAIHQLVRCANTFDGVSAGMLEELQMKTGRRDGLIVHSGFEPSHLHALETMPAILGSGELRIAYVGTIVCENDFCQMLAALKNVRGKLPRKPVLEFFGGRNYRTRSWFEPDWMIEHPLFTDDALIEALRRCEWGIVVMDIKGEDPRYSRFSFPNKIGTYLAAGVPVLGFGHAETSLSRIMRAQRLGKFSSDVTRECLEEYLLETLRLPQPRNSFRDDILQCARSEFNAAEIRERLWCAWRVQ